MKLAGLAVMAVAFFGSTAAASADPVVFNFDESIINLGGGSGPQGLKLIDPDADPADAPATLNGEVDTATDAFTAAASGFTFPQKTTQVSGQDVVVTITANAARILAVVPAQLSDVKIMAALVVAGTGVAVEACQGDATILRGSPSWFSVASPSWYGKQ